MILSMTGYGTAISQTDGTTVAVEIRSVNHRFLDLHIRLSREYIFLENEIQQVVRSVLSRGRVDVSIAIQATNTAEMLINAATARSYLEAARKLRDELGIDGSLDLKTLMSFPGVLQNRESVQSAGDIDRGPVTGMVLQSVRQALEGVLHMREQEGEALQADLLKHLASIDDKAGKIEALGPASVIEFRRRFQERLTQLVPENGIDPQRFNQEVALAAEKSDISEEVARLESHLAQYRSLIESGKEAGKKMDFLLQEMQREINTVLSKSGNLEITRHGIGIKADIEKLREQVQNVE